MLKVLKRFFLFGLIAIKTGTGFALGFSQDTILPAQTADLSLRFHHIEPRLSVPGLVASWSMDEGSGYEFADESNSNHTAYITGHHWNTSNSGLTASFRKKGKRGGAVFLDGTQWIQVKDSTDLNSSSVTVSLWVNQVQPAAKKTVLWSRENEKAGYTLYLTENGNIALQWKEAEGKATSLQATALILQNWTHLSFTIDGEKKEAALFINGKISVKRQGTTFSTTHINEDVYIGGTSENGNACFKGYVDEVCLYNKALDPALLHDLFINGHPKIYTQYRTTIDNSKAVWTSFRGNQPIPHSKEGDTKLLLRFNGDLTSAEGIKPINFNGTKGAFVPGSFGGAYQSVSGSKALIYPAVLSSPEGSFEAWYISEHSSSKQLLFKINGDNVTMELLKENNTWIALLKDKDKQTRIAVANKPSHAGTLSHIALTWKENVLALWLNGVLKKEIRVATPGFNGIIELGGAANERFTCLLDDIRISSTAKSWGQVCPAGFWDTESAALDFMDDFDDDKRHAFHWTTFSNTHQWQIAEDKPEKGSCMLKQAVPQGFHATTHPFAYGFSSSMEAGVFFDEIKDGDIGLFTNSNRSTALFTGIRFSMNSKKAELVLAVYKSGKITIQKNVPYPFRVKKNKRYTLTLSVYEDMARGFVDGNNLIVLPLTEKAEAGYAGLFTCNSSGSFDDVHFSALTPAADDSRMLQARIMTASDENKSSFVNHSFNAFRWKKRYGLLPWQRSYKNPEPPGNILGPNDVARPNKTQSWRSEDAANSDIITIDGTMYYCMRGNPDHNGSHGLAAIGMLLTKQHQFDGVHFNDLNKDSLGKQGIGLFHGHKDKGGVCADAPPRAERFQVNDEGMVFVDGKILIIAREFRNRQQGYPPFRRLVFGLFDVGKHKWISHEPFTVSWSAMNPDSCNARFTGINATPEIISLIDPKSDKPVILLFYNEFRNSMITGLSFDGKDLNLHPDYPSRKIFSKRDRDAVYGQRVLFDNGIYYMHVNAGSDSTRLRKDWPDRFQLFTALDPYQNTWTESAENSNKVRPYFTRGDEMDPDNAAIWQGTMFKFRNRYYMYYENYHSINNCDNAYDLYDEAHSGSRVGYATAN